MLYAKSLIALLFLFTSLNGLADGKMKVVTTFTIIADMAKEVAGDKAVVSSITKAGAEIHEYQPTPKDIVKAQDADLLLLNGLNLELWFEKFYNNLEDVPSVIVTDGINPMGISKGPYNGKPNPHAWMSPSDAVIYVKNIAKAFSTHDPDNANDYETNASAYIEKINNLVKPYKEQLASIPQDQRWLVSSEGAFSYLARDLGLKELYIWPINADKQGTPKQVKHLIDTIRQENIQVIFSESTVSNKPAKQIAKETAINYGGVLYVDSLSKPTGEVPTYLDLIDVTIKTIVAGLLEES